MSDEPQGPALLVKQLRDMAEKGGGHLEPRELLSIATVVESLDGALESGALELRKAGGMLADMNTKNDRMRLVVKLCRTFLCTELEMPHIGSVRAFLRKYVDEGSWPPIPWPAGLPPVARFLANEGYEPVDGVVQRKP